MLDNLDEKKKVVHGQESLIMLWVKSLENFLLFYFSISFIFLNWQGLGGCNSMNQIVFPAQV